MAYSNEQNAGYRITSLTHGATEQKGALGCLLEKIVEREPIMAGSNNSAVARPVNVLDARVVARFLDTAGAIAETVAAANYTAAFTDAAGNAGSVVMGTMVAGSVRHTMERNQGGFSIEQDFELEGSSLTYTPTI